MTIFDSLTLSFGCHVPYPILIIVYILRVALWQVGGTPATLGEPQGESAGYPYPYLWVGYERGYGYGFKH